MTPECQNMQALEHFLARLYTDAKLRQAFIEQPEIIASSAGLEAATVKALLNMDWVGLELAAQSIGYKRRHFASQQQRWRWPWQRR